MGYINKLVIKTKEEGYDDENAEAKVCQDIILKAISMSSLRSNVTVKGGVVMRSISHNIRRATQDIDIDFIRYSLSDESIMKFIYKLNCIDDLKLSMTGKIEELKQQDYHGKRVYIRIEDDSGDWIESKIDLGVHKDLAIDQEEYCFDICLDDCGASLLMNSKEQMFTEKLCSLLKFGPFSRRYKDIFDLYYLSGILDMIKLMKCLEIYIYMNPNMKENNIEDILKRINRTFINKTYQNMLYTSRRNWIGQDLEYILKELMVFLEEVKSQYAVML